MIFRKIALFSWKKHIIKHIIEKHLPRSIWSFQSLELRSDVVVVVIDVDIRADLSSAADDDAAPPPPLPTMLTTVG